MSGPESLESGDSVGCQGDWGVGVGTLWLSPQDDGGVLFLCLRCFSNVGTPNGYKVAPAEPRPPGKRWGASGPRRGRQGFRGLRRRGPRRPGAPA